MASEAAGVYGELPPAYRQTTLGNVCEAGGVQTGPFGSQLHKEDYVSSGTPIVTVEHLGENRFTHQNLPFVCADDVARLAKYQLKEGDIVFSRVGSVDRRAIVREDENGWLFSGRCLRVRPNRDLVVPLWLSYLLGTRQFREYIRGVAVGATMPSINTKILSEAPVFVPPLDEQRRVAEILCAIDDRIENLRQTNATLEAIANALFKSWFVDFDPVRAKAEGRESEGMDAAIAALFPSEFEDSELGSTPKGWNVVPLLEACDLQGGAQPPASTFVEDPRPGYVRLLQIRDFSSDAHVTFVPEGRKLRYATEDDVLIGRYGSASGDKKKDSLGRVCRGLAGAYNVALMKLVPVLVGREYLLRVLDASSFYDYLQGVGAKAVQSGFSKQELVLYKIALPPRELADVYESFGLTVWRRQKAMRLQIQTLAEFRDSLLPRLISGKLRLAEAEAAIEEALA